MAPLPKRSALLGLPGVPWWGAIALAVGCTLIGAIGDILTSSDAVSDLFNWLFAIGCVLAALVVANSGLFTAAVQPALIMFVSVPMTAWFLSSTQEVSDKSLLLLAVPLINRFPWMAWVSGIVLAVCLVRWGLWRLAQRRERLAASQAKARNAKKPAERRPSSAAPVRRHKGSPDVPASPFVSARPFAAAPARKPGLADELPAGSRRRLEQPLERRAEPPLERRAVARTNGGPARPRIDPRGLDPLRHTPTRDLPPLTSGARYRQDPATWSSSSPSRSGKHVLPPARVPAPPEPRQTPRRRRDYYED